MPTKAKIRSIAPDRYIASRFSTIKLITALFGLSVTAIIGISARADDYGAAGSMSYLQQQYTTKTDDKVSLNTGAASYSVPIEVPPGTNGVQPAIALTYNSQAHWGVTGYGWSISGLGEISRSVKRGLPTYTSSDTFVLNGEDLVQLSATDSCSYHTKHETFARVCNVGGTGAGSYWTVTDKDGVERRYGYNADSRIEAVGKSGQVRVWALDRVKDANGSYFKVAYNEDTVNGDYYPATILYTFNDAGGIGAYRKIAFNWQARPDVHASYAEGALVMADQRLASIAVYMGTDATGAGGGLLRQYNVSYTTGSAGKSLLAQVQACGSDGTTCLPPTQFSYRATPSALFGTVTSWAAVSNTSAVSSSAIREISGPFTGGSTIYDLVDMDGDGLPDFVYRNNGDYWVALNTGNGFGALTDWGAGDANAKQLRPSAADGYYDVMDVNGDGLPDYIYRSGSTGHYFAALNTGKAFGALIDWGAGDPNADSVRFVYSISRTAVDSAYVYTHYNLVDVNNDGRPDYVFSDSNGHYWVALNTGSGFGPLTDWGVPGTAGLGMGYVDLYPDANHTLVDLIDMNGDGLPDYVYRVNYTYGSISGDGHYYVALNTGNGFGPLMDWSSGFTNSYSLRDTTSTSTSVDSSGGLFGPCPSCATDITNTESTYFDLVDVNGDGLPDVVYRDAVAGTGDYFVALNTGNGFGPIIDWGAGNSNSAALRQVNSYQASLTSNVESWATVDLLDIDGDGLPDYVFRNGGSYTIQKNQNTAVDLLAVVTLPTGGTLVYNYASSSQFDNRDLSGKKRLPRPTWVVSSTTASDGMTDGTGVSGTTTYGYKGGLYDAPSREFRGFREVTMTAPSGDQTVTTYLQDDTFRGMVASVEQRSASASFKKTVNTYDSVAMGSGVVFPRLTNTQATFYDGQTTGKTVATNYSYDAYGNVTVLDEQGDTAVSGDERKTTNEYAYNTNLWILSKPKHTYQEGFDANGVWGKVRESWTFYDGQAYGYVARGNISRQERWRNSTTGGYACFVVNTQRCVVGLSAFDAYGNTIWTMDANAYVGASAINANGHTSDMTYDGTYKTAVVSVTDALNHVTQAGYDSFLRPTSRTDENNQVTTTTYDALSRVASVIAPGDSATYPTIVNTYVTPTNSSGAGVAPQYTLAQSRTTSGAAGTLDKYVFLDGLGRVIQNKAEGSAAGQWNTVDTWFDANGRKQATSAAYIAGSTSGGSTSPTTTTTTDDFSGGLSGWTFYQQTAGLSSTYALTLDTSTGNPANSALVSGDWTVSNGTAQSFGMQKTYNRASGGDVALSFDVRAQSGYSGGSVTNASVLVQDADTGTTFINQTVISVAATDSGWVSKSFSLPSSTLGTTSHIRVIVYLTDAWGSNWNQMVNLDNVKFSVTTTSSGTTTTTTTNTTSTGIVTARDATQPRMSYSYDALDRVTKTTYYDGSATTMAYDRWNVTITDALGQTVSTLHDAYGRPLQAQENNGGATYTTAYKHHSATGELLKITDQAGNNYSFSYDSLGRKIAQSDPDRGAWSFGYDPNGNMTSQTDAAGRTTSIQYDALNRPTRKTLPDNTYYLDLYDTAGTTSFNIGRLVKTQGFNASNTAQFEREFAYDALGRKTAEYLRTDWNGSSYGKRWKTSFTYDALSRLVTTTYPGGNAEEAGEVVNTSYDSSGFVMSVAGTNTYLASALYTPQGKIDTYNYGNGTVAKYDYYDTATETDPSNGSRAFSYRLKRIQVAKGTSGLIDITYEHDAVGNVRKVTDNLDATKSQTFGYDALSRLTSAIGVYGTKSYTYSPTGDLLTKDGRSYSYATGSHRIASDGTYTYTHDANGSITTRGSQSFTYDTAIRLTQTNAGGVTENYVYGEGEGRIKKVSGAKVTYYVNTGYEENWDSSTNTKSEVVKHYFAGPQRLATRDNEGLKYQHPDHLSSATRVSDVNGAQIRALWYEPFGTQAASSGTAMVKYKFTGKEQDATGLYYYTARYYDPVLGRFLSADSVLPHPYDPQLLNRYAYARNNPMKLVDPDGHNPIVISGLVATGLGITLNYITNNTDLIPKEHRENVRVIGSILESYGTIATAGAPGAAVKTFSYVATSPEVTNTLKMAGSNLLGLTRNLQANVYWTATTKAVISAVGSIVGSDQSKPIDLVKAALAGINAAMSNVIGSEMLMKLPWFRGAQEALANGRVRDFEHFVAGTAVQTGRIGEIFLNKLKTDIGNFFCSGGNGCDQQTHGRTKEQQDFHEMVYNGTFTQATGLTAKQLERSDKPQTVH